MDWYHYVALLVILSQMLFLACIYRNYHYALNKYERRRIGYRPRTVLIVPCKGLDADFHKNITSLFNQDYEDHLLWFVVADKSDPAYSELCKLKERLSADSKAQDVRIFIAGQGQLCSQKIHNQLYCYHRISDDIEVLAFADSDICVRSDWLSHLVYPLRQPKNGASTGYRWFVPQRNNLATLALSAVNAKVAQVLGNSRFNHAWGGSMAISVDTFRKVGLEKIWPRVLTDDLPLSCAVKKAGLKVAFVPACLVASYEYTTWPALFEFGRRQFVITRVSAPKTWWLGFSTCLYSVLGLWGGAVSAVYAAMLGLKSLSLFVAVPFVFLVGQLISAALRQRMIGKLLKKDLQRMRAAAAADILLSWLWSLLLLSLIISSAFGRTIVWRGIRYRLQGSAENLVVSYD
jgi:cellulose synthase/poly-beta-1,6-N-acetylglucosamine synthase-like glycosyltransferase